MSILTYNGQNITQRPDGYVNATQMCQANGKQIGHWIETNDYNRYTQALSTSIGIPIDQLVLVKRDGQNELRGTWIHPKLAIKLARWISVEFELWCDDHIKTLMESGSTSLASPPDKLDWYERLKLYKAKTKIPVGYFSIFEELTTGLVSEFEHAGCNLPHGSVPDISVGKCFCNHLRANNYDLDALTMKYKHYYPDGRVINANIYHDSLLAEYRKWVQLTYKMTQLPKYLKQNYPMALPTFSKILGLPEGSY
jgi:hypothetical protein